MGSTLDGAGHLHRNEALFAALRASKAQEVWVDLQPTASAASAISTILTTVFAGPRRFHFKTNKGWLDAEVLAPLPPGSLAAYVVHTRIAVDVDSDKLFASWQSDRSCDDAMPGDATIPLKELRPYLATSCGALGSCLDEVSLKVESTAPAERFLEVVDALRSQSKTLRLSLNTHNAGVPAKSIHRCGKPLRPLGVGSLGPGSIRAAVLSHQDALRTCYELEAQKNPDLRGDVTAAWTINEFGIVTEAHVVSSTAGSESLERCIVRQVQSWRFPGSDGETTIAAYPFHFGIVGPPDADTP
jgi:hypothetical protein